MAQSKFNISNFQATVLANGLAKPNRFEVTLTQPPCIQVSALKEFGSQLSLYCEQAQLPMTRIITSRQFIFGAPSFHPIGADYGGDNFTLVFLVDRDMRVKQYFDTWVDGIVNRSSGITYYADNYTSHGMTIAQLDEQDKETYKIKFSDVFPISVNPLQLDYGQNNVVHKLSVSFCYRRWDSLATPATPPRRQPRSRQTAEQQPRR